MTMSEIASAILLCSGLAFLLLASIGILRMPDVFMRASSSTKAATLGVGCVLLAAAVHFAELRVTTRALAAIAFLFLTAPVAAHMIVRAAYLTGVPLWEGTIGDELRGRYNRETHTLHSPEQPAATADSTERSRSQ